MSWQPAATLYPDAEVELVLGMQQALDARDIEPVYVDQRVPNPRRERMVIFTRDGGAAANFRDVARMRCRVWAATFESARDLARLVEPLMQTLVDGATILQVEKQSGPYEVADDSVQPQFYLLFDVHFRGGDLDD